MATKTSPKSRKPSEEDAVPFEDLLDRLESLVGTLEEGEIPLEDSLKHYEEGVALVRRAQGRLDAMDARLEELLQNGKTDGLALASFGEEDTTGEADR